MIGYCVMIETYIYAFSRRFYPKATYSAFRLELHDSEPNKIMYDKILITNHQTPMTCSYGFSHFRHLQNCCNRDEIQFLNP